MSYRKTARFWRRLLAILITNHKFKKCSQNDEYLMRLEQIVWRKSLPQYCVAWRLYHKMGQSLIAATQEGNSWTADRIEESVAPYYDPPSIRAKWPRIFPPTPSDNEVHEKKSCRIAHPDDTLWRGQLLDNGVWWSNGWWNVYVHPKTQEFS